MYTKNRIEWSPAREKLLTHLPAGDMLQRVAAAKTSIMERSFVQLGSYLQFQAGFDPEFR